MSLTVYGDNTAPLVLPHEAKKPNPRTLRIKFLSKKEIRAWQKRMVEARNIDDTNKRDAAYDAAMAEVVAGWDNIAKPFTIEGISEEYTLPEVMAIMEMIPMAMVPGVDDLKK